MSGFPRAGLREGEVIPPLPENPKKTQYIMSGRTLAAQLVNILKQAQDYDAEYNKLGFVASGADPITQQDLDYASAKTFPSGGAGSMSLTTWEAGVYAIQKNGTDYAGGEDVSLLKIAS